MSLKPILRGLQESSHLWDLSDEEPCDPKSGVALRTSRAQDDWEAATMMNHLRLPARVSCRFDRNSHFEFGSRGKD
jgi:hypothetical protein